MSAKTKTQHEYAKAEELSYVYIRKGKSDNIKV